MGEFIGPKLPDHLKKVDGDDDEDCYGPALPPSLKMKHNQNQSTIIGPHLPPFFSLNQTMNVVNKVTSNQITNEKIDDGENNGDDKSDENEGNNMSNIFGPLPLSHKDLEEVRHSSRTSHRIPENLSSKREDWMTNIPDNNSIINSLGLKSVTSFSRKPSTVEKKLSTKSSNLEEEQLTKAIEEYQKLERPKSLIEIHQENMDKKKKTETVQKRKVFEFDYEKDLKMQKVDVQKSRAFIAKVEGVDNRFSSGSRKFL